MWWPWAKRDMSIVTSYSTAALVSKSQRQCSEPCCSAGCQGSRQVTRALGSPTAEPAHQGIQPRKSLFP